MREERNQVVPVLGWCRAGEVACVLCGSADRPTDEDVIPKWLLRAFNGVCNNDAYVRWRATSPASPNWAGCWASLSSGQLPRSNRRPGPCYGWPAGTARGGAWSTTRRRARRFARQEMARSSGNSPRLLLGSSRSRSSQSTTLRRTDAGQNLALSCLGQDLFVGRASQQFGRREAWASAFCPDVTMPSQGPPLQSEVEQSQRAAHVAAARLDGVRADRATDPCLK
ncbi:hypothetical protein ABH935_009543 [Catenulispora sp. GAS73]